MIIASTICFVIAALFGIQVFLSAFRPGVWQVGNAAVRVLLPLAAGLVLRLIPMIDRLAT